ncbi:MBL fold metallo-hydrolase RNA specificity domain-containing protein [Bradyrhizobium sp. ARR65]|uniref:MBL fold metallo-hydrolase RNA specificity domain-containing protein n=1 Tax=Bradyrhizobium sp. ARR65 TaxID=1040989 RepID=UPI001FD938A6|nr:MBL fold metallo-hydrolase RNA specificity domain-containing protein [Bradyrhizobium sp. ARR65]
MLGDLDRATCLTGALGIWSQWDGYLAQGRGKALSAELALRGIPLDHAHTSGHASIRDLKRLARAVAPKMLVPVHTFPRRFPSIWMLSRSRLTANGGRLPHDDK